MSNPRIRFQTEGLGLAVLVASLIGCGGHDTRTQQFSITVSPSSVNVAAEASQQFNAIVTGSSSTAVTWQVNGVNGGNATVGTITEAGLYTAPAAATNATVSAEMQVLLEALSNTLWIQGNSG